MLELKHKLAQRKAFVCQVYQGFCLIEFLLHGQLTDMVNVCQLQVREV